MKVFERALIVTLFQVDGVNKTGLQFVSRGTSGVEEVIYGTSGIVKTTFSLDQYQPNVKEIYPGSGNDVFNL